MTRGNDTTHECPINGCARRVPWHMAMCRDHWRAVPREIQRRVYAAWDNGAGYLTDEHAAVLAEAQAAVEARS